MYLKGDLSVSLSVFVLKHILKHFFCPLFLHFPTEVISDLYSHIFRDPRIGIYLLTTQVVTAFETHEGTRYT